LLLLSALNGYSQNKDTFQVYFPFNQSQLTKEAENYVDALIFNDTLIHGDRLIILGYADYVGSNGYNDSLSRARAANICSYLIRSGFEKSDIKLMMGRGKVERNGLSGKDGYPTDRKVQMIIDHTVLLHPEPAPAKPVVVVKPSVVKPQAKPAVMPAERIDITKLKVNQTFALNNIIFQPGSDIYFDQSLPDLERLLDFMVQNPAVNISVEGHICCKGPNPLNEIHDDGSLSQLRAAAVCNYLVNNGIAKNRMYGIGLGNKDPVVPNEVTNEDRVKNRRVEIRILSK
jgi:outer membrane protein OmpA-like peptidoglycan-associated protein